MPLANPVTLPKPTRLEHYRKAEELIAAADALDDAAAIEKDPKKAEALALQSDRLVAKAHVRAVLSTVDRTVAR